MDEPTDASDGPDLDLAAGTTVDDRRSPLVIEAAISPLRWDRPAQTVDTMVTEADACIRAGAAIVHHHHDMRLPPADAIAVLVETSARILDRHPEALIYTDYLSGRTAEDENLHLAAMAEAGVLTMYALDPGITTFGSADDDGIPTRTYTDGLRFDEIHRLVTWSREVDVPVSLGVFEPGQLRWILAYEQAAGFSPGTMIKLYIGGAHRVDLPDTPGINFGMPATTAALDVYRTMIADAGSTLPWIVSLFGDPVLESPLAAHAMHTGGHLRVGVEDAATDAVANADLVRAAVALAESAGREVVTGAEARSVLRRRPAHA